MRILYFFIFLFLVASIAFVLKESHPPKLEEEQTLKKHTLENGLTVIIKNTHKIPLVAVQLVVKCGSSTENKFAGCGISHFVEHMIFKGTPTRAVGEIEKQIKSYGGDINGSTSHDSTEFHLIVRKEHLNEALELLVDCIVNPAFDERELEKERQVILNEIRMNRDEPSRRASVLLWENAYFAHPYKYPVIGYEDLFKQIKREDLIEYHKANYIPNNIVLSIVGDIENGSALDAVYDTFGRLPRAVDVRALAPEEPLQMSMRSAEEKIPDLKLSFLLLAFHSTRFADEDLYSLDLLAAALGQGESSRLYRRLVRDEKLAYSVSAFNYTPKDPGLFVIVLTLEDNKIEEALKEVLKELNRVKVRSISRAELKKIKRSTLSGYIYERESIEVQAQDYAMSYALTGDYNFSRRYIEGINSVRAADVSKVARKYLDVNNSTVVKLMPKKEIAVSAKPISKVGKDFDIKKLTLPNGATLLMHEDCSTPVVSMHILFKGGVRVEDEKMNGVSYLTSNMLLKGTKSHTAQWISKEVESRGIILSTYSGNNSLGISLKCLKDEFDFSLSLVKDILSNATFTEDEIAITKEIQLAQIKAQDDDIFATASKTLIKTIFKTHPYKMNYLGTKESINNLKKDDLSKFYRRFVVPDNMVVAVFGDIDIKKMQRKLTRVFSGLRGGKLKEPKVLIEPEQKELRYSIKQMQKEQAVLMVGYPGTDVKNPDKYVLEIINSILTRKGGRIYMDIRERHGLSYTLGSFSALGIDPGYFAFYVATTSENIELVKELLLKQIDLFKKEGPTEEELKLAKADLLGDYFRGLEINSVVGFKVGLDELYGLGYNDIFRYPMIIESITAEDVMNVANKYFVDSNLNVVMVLPILAQNTILKSEAK
ncbi:MAG: hypothetical protein AMJ78_05715 [Omnitrophica WOR_2 bacterium SM23_29]|nr:MAG: hypothetical protein AMJ78_05715 [Omnitrophica WOR_2 bacterium SM23_29]